MNLFVDDLAELAWIIVEDQAFGGFLRIDHSGDTPRLMALYPQEIGSGQLFYSVHAQIIKHSGLWNPDQADAPAYVKLLMARFGGVVFAELVTVVDEDQAIDFPEAFDLSDIFSAYAEEVVDELAAFRW